MFLDTATGLGFKVVGRLTLLEGGFLIVSEDGDPEITASSGFNTTVSNLLRFPCEFIEPRDFKDKPSAVALLRDEVPLDFGLKFNRIPRSRVFAYPD